MAAHKRNRSKGSFSIFSLDTIRSLSRAGSRQAARIPSKDELHDHAESGLSYQCDPHHQPPPSPRPESIKCHSPRSLITMTPTQDRNTDGDAQDNVAAQVDKRLNEDARATVAARAVAHGKPSRQSVSHKLRPLSWFSFPRSSSRSRYPRSFSTQLPKTASTSTVARSVISAPTLTSTTNVAVARTEGVHCGEISDAAFSQSTWDSQVGWIARSSTERAHASGFSFHENPSESSHQNQNGAFPAARALKRGRIFRFGDAIKMRFRNSPLGNQDEPASRARRFSRMDDTNGHSSSTANPSARRGTETFNLYKGKIKGLTGNGHIRRKSVTNSKDLLGSQQDPPLLSELAETDATGTNAVNDDNDCAFGSLTRSFASAVEKLDFHSTAPRSISFLRSRSSFFNMKKGPSGGIEHQEVKKSEIGISTPNKKSSLQNSHRAHEVQPSEIGATEARENSVAEILAARRLKPGPLVFSTEQNRYAPSKPSTGYPQGVNGLRMHPATPAPTPTPKSGQAETSSRLSEDGSESISLEDAPIYSPSLGDLSQYARDTPCSTKHTSPKPRRSVVIDTTPTRVLTKENKNPTAAGRKLKKSRSGLNLFNKTIVSRTASKRQERDSRASILPRTDSAALQQRDTNQKMQLQDDKGVKKSRSMHFGGLFKGESNSTLGPTTPRDRGIAFQPATPSPLRNVTRVRRSQSTAQDSPPFTGRTVTTKGGGDDLVERLRKS